MKLIPDCNVDCFGRTIFTGVMFVPSENAEDVIEGFEIFGYGHASEKVVLMTDEAPAYRILGNHSGFSHLYCIKLFETTIWTVGGLAERRNTFRSETLKILYHIFDSETEFENYFILLHAVIQ